MKELIQTIHNQRQNADAVRNAISSVLSIRRDLDKYLQLSAYIPEKKQLAQLKNQLQELMKRKGQLGLFDLKGKKDVDSAIKITELKIADLSKVVATLDAPYTDQILENRQLLLRTQAVAFGCTDTMTSIRNGNAFNYLYVANDIPEELLTGSKEAAVERTAEPEMDEESQNAITAQASAPLFCKKCGYKLLPDSAFCTRCGTSVQIRG